MVATLAQVDIVSDGRRAAPSYRRLREEAVKNIVDRSLLRGTGR
jgi:hypothetical protein